MLSTIALLIVSPVGSVHVNCGARSTKTLPQRPRMSARMNAIGGDWARQKLSALIATSSGTSIATTIVYWPSCASGNAPSSACTATPGLSSCIWLTHAVARFLPASASDR